MSQSPFAIVNLRAGVRRDVEPFLVDNDAFPVLENAYLFRGRIQRRSCFSAIGATDGKLKRVIGQTDALGNFNDTLLNIPIPSGLSVFLVGTTTYTDGGGGGALLVNGIGTASLNLLTGVFAIVGGPPTTDVIYEPGLPVMGLRFKEEDPINDEAYMGFDTRYSYYFDIGSDDWVRQSAYKTTSNEFIWTGLDSDLFWTFNYLGAMWTTNNVPGNHVLEITSVTAGANAVITFVGGNLFNVGDVVAITNTGSAGVDGKTGTVTVAAAGTITTTINNTGAALGAGGVLYALTNSISGDGIRWYDGPDSNVTNTVGWVNFCPPLDETTNPILLKGCLCIVAYRGYLIALNTYEDVVSSLVPVHQKQRARWCQLGTPYYVSPVPINQGAQFDSWFSDVNNVGKGGFSDAPTNEAIVSAEFIKDTLIVYFERSTWQLVYTSNSAAPFVWQKINTELGCESTFSVVPFDRGVFAIGNYGVITCDSVNVSRIDQKIPDEVFSIQNKNDGVKRVYGVRDYTSQLVYFTYPVLADEDDQVAPVNQDIIYPNRVLVYNYIDGSYAEFDDSFTCFGTFQKQSDLTWGQAHEPWGGANRPWNSGFQQAKYPDVSAGNQQGFTMVFSQQAQEGLNTPSLIFSNFTTPNIITSPNHNLTSGQYVYIQDAGGLTNINDIIFRVIFINANQFSIDPDPMSPIGGTYTGGGKITVMPNFNIETKIFSPYLEAGKGVRLSRVEVLADRTGEGQITIQVYPNYSITIPVVEKLMNTKPDSIASFQSVQDKIWHRVYLNVNGSFVQLRFSMSDEQMRELEKAVADVKIHGINLYFSESGRMF